MTLKAALLKFCPIRPSDYSYLGDGEWLWREISVLGCRANLFHIGRDGKVYLFNQPWDGSIDCFCSFWDAQ